MIGVKRKSSLLKDICRFSIFSKKKYSKRSMYTLYHTNFHQINQKLMNISNRKEMNIFNNSKRLAPLLSEYGSQNLKDNYKFDLNLNWMMMVRYIYDGAVSSIRELKVLSSRIEWYTYIYVIICWQLEKLQWVSDLNFILLMVFYATQESTQAFNH